jgi:hypothetical protein
MTPWFDLLTALIDLDTLFGRRLPEEAGAGDKYLALTYQQGAYHPYEAIVRAAAERSVSTRLRRRARAALGRVAAMAGNRRGRRRAAPAARRRDQLLDRARSARRGCGIAFAALVTAEEAGFYKPRPEPYRAVLAQLGTATTGSVPGGLGRRRTGRQGRRHAGLLAQSHGVAGARWRRAGFHGNLAAAAPGARVMPSTGQTSLLALETPRLVLDLDRLERNCAAMRARCATFRVALRAHLKTAKSVDVARIATNASGITVSAEGGRALRAHAIRHPLYVESCRTSSRMRRAAGSRR